MTEQHVKLIQFYFEHHRFFDLTQRAYMRHFNERNPPSKSTTLALIRRFQQIGSKQDLPWTGRSWTDHINSFTDKY